MSRPLKQLPENLKLEPTLARRVNQLRELRNLTLRDLAKLSRLPLYRIEDIESGMETWLSTTDRQMIARALVVEPMVLQEVETRQTEDAGIRDWQQILFDKILSGERELSCPQCGGALKCSVQEALDMDSKPLRFPKAFCTKCPFILK